MPGAVCGFLGSDHFLPGGTWLLGTLKVTTDRNLKQSGIRKNQVSVNDENTHYDIGLVLKVTRTRAHWLAVTLQMSSHVSLPGSFTPHVTF